MACTLSRSSSARAGSTPASSWLYQRIRPSKKAVVTGLPKSWQTAPSITAIFAHRGRPSMRARAWSMTISVCTHTSPSGCQSGSCSQPMSAAISGSSDVTTPASRANWKPSDGRAGSRSSFSNSPQIRSGGRSSSAIVRQTAIVPGSTVNSKRAASCIARSTRRLSSAKVAGSTRRSRRASRSARPPQGSRYAPVSGSNEIALIVKSRRRAASSTDMAGSPSTTNPRWPRPTLDSRRGRDTSMGPSL